jgi:hypothetical protein
MWFLPIQIDHISKRVTHVEKIRAGELHFIFDSYIKQRNVPIGHIP